MATSWTFLRMTKICLCTSARWVPSKHWLFLISQRISSHGLFIPNSMVINSSSCLAIMRCPPKRKYLAQAPLNWRGMKEDFMSTSSSINILYSVLYKTKSDSMYSSITSPFFMVFRNILVLRTSTGQFKLIISWLGDLIYWQHSREILCKGHWRDRAKSARCSFLLVQTSVIRNMPWYTEGLGTLLSRGVPAHVAMLLC